MRRLGSPGTLLEAETPASARGSGRPQASTPEARPVAGYAGQGTLGREGFSTPRMPFAQGVGTMDRNSRAHASAHLLSRQHRLGPPRPAAHVDNALDSVKVQDREKLIRRSAAVADRIDQRALGFAQAFSSSISRRRCSSLSLSPVRWRGINAMAFRKGSRASRRHPRRR